MERLIRVGGRPLQPQHTESADTNRVDGDSVASASHVAEQDDPAEAGAAAQQQQHYCQQQCHMHTYSVVWHEIYKVPVLYLAGCRQGEVATFKALKHLEWAHVSSYQCVN